MSSATPGALGAPLPVETPLVRGPDIAVLAALLKNPNAAKDLQAYLITEPWATYLSQFTTSFGSIAQRVASATLLNQSASIALTTLPTQGSTGVYRFWYEADIISPGATSSLIVTVTFTQRGITKSFSGAAMTGNLTTTIQSNTWILPVDANTPVQYSTTYASTGAPMTYGLTLGLEAVNL